MFSRRRIITVLTACLLLLTFRLYYARHGLSLLAGGGKPAGIIQDDLRNTRPQNEPWKNVFPVGQLKSPGAEYSRTIVISSMSVDNMSWVDHELGDLLKPNGPFEKAIYVADDRKAPLHPKKNKGHEAMIYLSYIIDHYENLPDVSIFIHSDRWTWHNNELMENDMAAMIRYLSPERVTRDGYMNLRCHWDPGCPSWLLLQDHPAQDNVQKHEEKAIAERWHELFPLDSMPSILSQPCCAQFALSRDRIRAIPLQRYVFLRSWILRTPLDDYRSGRVFEYLWQFIFTGNAEVCPAMHVCYCDGYGMCFGGAKQFDDWFELRFKKAKYESQIRRLTKQRQSTKENDKDRGKDRGKDDSKHGSKTTGQNDEKDDSQNDHKENDRHNLEEGDHHDESSASGERLEELQQKVKGMKAKLQKLKDDAFLRGRSEKARAEEAGR